MLVALFAGTHCKTNGFEHFCRILAGLFSGGFSLVSTHALPLSLPSAVERADG